MAMEVYVWDSPLFGHRGVMLDTSRNFYGVEDILRTMEAMRTNKLKCSTGTSPTPILSHCCYLPSLTWPPRGLMAPLCNTLPLMSTRLSSSAWSMPSGFL
ncbi:hypothetical protein ACFX10_028591 [Malus domestica]